MDSSLNWLVSNWDITPIGDMREHVERPDCWCHPVADVEVPYIYIHNSLDEREKYETGERKPS